MSLHSLYTLLWANLGVMSMAILFLPEAGDVIRRKFISPQTRSTAKSYFASYLMRLWRCIPQNLGISEEDCSFLLRACFLKFCNLKVNLLHQLSVPPFLGVESVIMVTYSYLKNDSSSTNISKTLSPTVHRYTVHGCSLVPRPSPKRGKRIWCSERYFWRIGRGRSELKSDGRTRMT